MGIEHPRVGRDPFAGFQQEQIAGDQVAASTTSTSPLRRTRAVGASMSWRAASARSARFSWM
jgi:hypothetical protein